MIVCCGAVLADDDRQSRFPAAAVRSSLKQAGLSHPLPVGGETSTAKATDEQILV